LHREIHRLMMMINFLQFVNQNSRLQYVPRRFRKIPISTSPARNWANESEYDDVESDNGDGDMEPSWEGNRQDLQSTFHGFQQSSIGTA
jgi:hypothetical protein